MLFSYSDPNWYQDWHSPYYNDTHRRFRDALREFVEREIMPYHILNIHNLLSTIWCWLDLLMSGMTLARSPTNFMKSVSKLDFCHCALGSHGTLNMEELVSNNTLIFQKSISFYHARYLWWLEARGFGLFPRVDSRWWALQMWCGRCCVGYRWRIKYWTPTCGCLRIKGASG